MKNLFILIFILIVFIISCDDNLWDYNYEAPALVNVTRIQGSVIDKYSGKPIHPADIFINGQETSTDENGNYLLNYIIPDEIEPNEQEIGYLSIIAPDYLHYSSSFIILPVHNTVDFELEYSPPIILDAISHGDTTQAIVKDPTMGVKIDFDGSSITIDMFIIVEYGTRVKSVAASVSNSVRYKIEKALGLPVSEVNVHVRGLRISNTD